MANKLESNGSKRFKTKKGNTKVWKGWSKKGTGVISKTESTIGYRPKSGVNAGKKMKLVITTTKKLVKRTSK